MKLSTFLYAAVLIPAGAMVSWHTASALFARAPLLAYKDESLPAEERVTDLLSRMTLEEKIGQLILVDKGSLTDPEDLVRYNIGGVLSGGGARPEENTPEGWSEMVGDIVDTSRTSRLGIPVLYGVDAVHGHGNLPGATLFPHAIGLGAANDPELVERIAAATAQEVAATGITWTYSPNLDAPEDIRWGRVYEAFSSDAGINASLGAAYVRGTQMSGPQVGVLATAKHYLGLGGSRWGTSVNEGYDIDQGVTSSNEALLRTFYLPPFQEAVNAGVLSVMAGLNTIHGKRIAANPYLLNDVLKGELAFKGFVVSDWYGVYAIPEERYQATVTAINAGIDMAMLPFTYKEFTADVSQAVQNGDITEERLDDAVRRILRAKFAAGLMDNERPTVGHEVIGSDEHRALAREAVAKSLVLLKNQDVLPLEPGVERTILVAGGAAHNTGRQSGGWTVEWQGVEGNVLPGATSILDGIHQEAGTGANVVYHEYAPFPVRLRADIGIAVVGEKPYAEGLGDEDRPVLSDEDLATIKELRRVSQQLIVIVVSGRPLILPVESRQWDAIIAAWLPGSEGEGVADVLFGRVPFTGKLPIDWPLALRQVPISASGVSKDQTAPLFPRGFGL